MEKTVLKVSNLSKSFKLPTEKSNSLKQAFINWTKGVKGYKKFTVLNNINFEVKEGDFLGIVGKNGSGKSTLLKIISKIYTPDSGFVKVKGKLIPFIELGVGFNPELTGKENVYMNGAMFGFSNQEIKKMYNEIVNFAELHKFMGQKLKNYSSGMQVRLAFSIAIKAQADILVLDEVLAVGDEAFQRKCNDYFQTLKKNKKTVILVTHNMAAVKKYCNKAIMLSDGNIVAQGEPENIASEYSLANLIEEAQVSYNEDLKKDQDIKKEVIKKVENFKVDLISPNKISQREKIDIRVQFSTTENQECFVAAVLKDLDRNVNVLIRNSQIIKAKKGQMNSLMASFKLPEINDSNIKVIINIRNKNKEILEYYPSHLSPAVKLERDDYPKNPITDSILYDYKEWNCE